jgi:hypothetical protein
MPENWTAAVPAKLTSGYVSGATVSQSPKTVTIALVATRRVPDSRTVYAL